MVAMITWRQSTCALAASHDAGAIEAYSRLFMTKGLKGVLVAYEYPVMQLGVERVIGSADDLELAASVSGIEEAISAWKHHLPDVGILDMHMQDGVATYAIAEIKKSSPDARIIVVNKDATVEQIFRVCNAGGRGYLLKSDTPETILLAIRTVLKGQKYLPDEFAAKLDSRDVNDTLSSRELNILTLVASGLSNKELAKEINVTEATIKFHLNQAYRKLGVTSRTAAVASAIRRGVISI